MKIVIYTTDGERQEIEVANVRSLYIKHDKFGMSAQVPQLEGSRIELGVQVYENKFKHAEWMPTVGFISGDFDEEGWVSRKEIISSMITMESYNKQRIDGNVVSERVKFPLFFHV